MENIVPKKLKIGDEVRIIAPSRSMKVLKDDVIRIAKRRLEKRWVKSNIWKKCNEIPNRRIEMR